MSLPLVVRIDADDARSAQQLKIDGWREIEVLETWEHMDAQYFADDHLLTIPKEHDWPLIRKLVAETKWQDRLHMDVEVPQEMADKAKLDWIEAISKCPRRQTYALIRRDENKGNPPEWCCGFITLWPGEDCDTIDLWAVEKEIEWPNYANYWWFNTSRRLLECAIVRSSSRRLRAGTQSTNIAARKCYERIGMHIVKRQLTFHKVDPNRWATMDAKEAA